DPFVAEKREGVSQPRPEGRQRRIRSRWVLVQEVDAQPRRHRSLAMKREKRIVHRVRVLAGNTARWFLRVKGAAVAVRRDAEPRVILERAQRRALARFWREQLFAQRLKREPQRGAADRAVGADRDALRFEPRLARAVRPRAALRGLQIDRPI